MLFGNFQIINIYVAKCFEKRCREIIESKLNDTQCGYRPHRSTSDQILLSGKILRNLKSMLKGIFPQNRGWEPLVYMNWIDSHSRVDEGVRSCKINRLLFSDNLALLASSQQSSACTRSVFCCVLPSRN